MNDLKRFSRGCLLPLALLVLMTYTGCSVHYNGKWRGVFPEDIRTGRHLARETDWIGSPGGGCGGVIFKLKKQTASHIQDEGLDFLKDKTHPRRLENRSIVWSIATTEEVSEIKWMLQCVSNDTFDAKISDAVKAEQAFLGRTGSQTQTLLLLLPEDRLAFAGYWD